jgi:hypothetical protein
MARETIHLVRAFRIGKGARLVAEAPVRCKSSDTAHRMGEKLAATMTGVVAFATSGDAELGGYDEEPTIIFKPAGFRPRSGTHEGAAAAPRSGHRP